MYVPPSSSPRRGRSGHPRRRYIGDELLDGLSLPAGCGMPPVLCSAPHTRRSVQPFHREGEIEREVRWRPTTANRRFQLSSARRLLQSPWAAAAYFDVAALQKYCYSEILLLLIHRELFELLIRRGPRALGRLGSDKPTARQRQGAAATSGIQSPTSEKYSRQLELSLAREASFWVRGCIDV